MRDTSTAGHTVGVMASDPAVELLELLHKNRERLVEMLSLLESSAVAEDLVYRFWHHSFKVYLLQGYTVKGYELLAELTPQGASFNPWFEEIVSAGTGHTFELFHNAEWVRRTLPIVHAFFHVKHLLSLAVRCSEEMESVPPFISSGFATLLELYQVR